MDRPMMCPHCGKCVTKPEATEILTEEVRQMLRDKLLDTPEFKAKMEHLIDVTSELDEDVMLIKMEIARLKGEKVRQQREELRRKAPLGFEF